MATEPYSTFVDSLATTTPPFVASAYVPITISGVSYKVQASLLAATITGIAGINVNSPLAASGGSIVTLSLNIDAATFSAISGQLKVIPGGSVRVNPSTDLFVSPIGSNANSGLDAGHPLQTMDYAYNTLLERYDLKKQPLNIILDSANGVYGENFTAQGRPVGQGNDTSVKFVGSPGVAEIQGSFNTNGRGCSLSIQNLKLRAPAGATYGSAPPTVTIGNNTSLIVLSGVTFGDNPGGIDIQPTWNSYLNVANTYTIDKTNNVKTFNATSGNAVIGVNSTSGILVGDIMSHVPNATPSLGAISYSVIQPFSKVTNVNSGASQITLDRNAISTTGAAQNCTFTRASSHHIQADQRAQIFYNQGAGINVVIKNVAAYTSAYATADLASYLSGESIVFPQDSVGSGLPGQVNGPPFKVFNGALFDPGVATITAWPGTTISISGTLTAGSQVITGLPAADQAQINNYMGTYPNDFGLMITGTGLRSGAKIAAIGSLSGSNLTMTLVSNSSGGATLTLGGFVYNGAIHQQLPPPVVD